MKIKKKLIALWQLVLRLRVAYAKILFDFLSFGIENVAWCSSSSPT